MPTFYAHEQSPSFFAFGALEATAGGAVHISTDPHFVAAANPAPERKVALVSGGGAGHEPMHAGFVGRGGLDAAAPGEVFTSPHSRQIHHASAAVAKEEGVLHIVKNYTGDRLNFAIAAERLRAEGINVEEVVVDDDLGTDDAAVGRRGIAATVIVEKILGAAADTGASLRELKELGERIVNSTRSISVARRAHTAPGAKSPAFTVDEGELEYGVGIHGESAREQATPRDLHELTARMTRELLDALQDTDPATNGVIVLINGLGGTAPLELLHVAATTLEALDAHDVPVHSVVTGSYTTALDMAGFSITLTTAHHEFREHWLADHDTLALPSPRPYTPRPTPAPSESDAGNDETPEPSTFLSTFVTSLRELRQPLDALDQKVGDGDVGTNLAHAAHAALRRSTGPDASLSDDLQSIATAFLDDTGGSSGPLFGLVLNALAEHATTADTLIEGIREGQAAVTRVGGAQPGDRTIVDALDPAQEASALDSETINGVIDGAQNTSSMVAGRGRSSYLGDKVQGTPDPGAIAMAHVLTVIAEHATGTPMPAAHERIAELLAS